MDIKEEIMKRKSTRKFLPGDNIECDIKEILEEVLREDYQHPFYEERNADGENLYKRFDDFYFVICDRNEKNAVARVMQNGKDSKIDGSYFSANAIIGAKALILIYYKDESVGSPCDFNNMMLYMGAICERILLQTQHECLCSLWIRDTCYQEEEINKLLWERHAIKKDYSLLCGIAIGYSSDNFLINNKYVKSVYDILM